MAVLVGLEQAAAADTSAAAGRVAEGRRVMVVWCPDWPVVAAALQHELSLEAPLAVVERGEVFACSAAARREGVKRGMRRRDAAARCPELVVVDRVPEAETRSFEAVLSAVEEVSAGVAPVKPGLCALGVPSRFYGGEAAAAAAVAEHLVAVGVWDCRIGIADGIFAAEQAARQALTQDCTVVPVGGSAGFLARLPVSALEDAALVSLLRRLGLRTLGDFADLPARDVLTRFGSSGAWLHRLARGRDHRTAVSRQAPLELEQRVAFEPPLETIEPIAFSSRQTAERTVTELARHGLVCTEVRVVVSSEGGWTGSRVWLHSRWFTAADLIDRLYWQLQGDPAPDPVSEVRFVPETVESMADHGEGLWGSAPDERVERGVARLQGMLGPEEVLAPAVQGGRSPRQRQLLTPWGDRAATARPTALPWPGSIPPPAPARVFPQPHAALVTGADGRPVAVTSRGLVTGDPVLFTVDQMSPPTRVQAWAGPWPIDELWWDPVQARQVARFQVVGVDGSAWLLVVENGRWWCEARYD
jgi:protein ImuB